VTFFLYEERGRSARIRTRCARSRQSFLHVAAAKGAIRLQRSVLCALHDTLRREFRVNEVSGSRFSDQNGVQ
jgi:hypothetical protein